jgi:hypothetical protein
MTGTITVTPTLRVGDVPRQRPDTYRATTTGEALQLIDAGLVAVLPAGAWDLLEDVLRVLVDDHAHVLRLLHAARTGEWRGFRCDCPSCLAGLTRPRRAPDGSLIGYDEPAGTEISASDPSGSRD